MLPTTFITSGMKAFVEDVDQERGTQLAKFGEQHHPDIEPRDIPEVTHAYYASRADIWKQVNAERAVPRNEGRCVAFCASQEGEPHTHTAWDGVLLEGVYEALAESDPVRLRAELIQVGAVCAAWVAALDQRNVEDYPCQIGVFCDECHTQALRDYVVNDHMTSTDRIDVARTHLVKHEGWSCDGTRDLCPGCKPRKAD